MKTTLLIAALLTAATAHAQLPGKAVPSYTTKRGTTFHKGDTLRFGLGQRNDGEFKYAEVLPGLVQSGGPLPRSWAGVPALIKELKQQQLRNKLGTRTVAIFKAGSGSAVIDLDSAEEIGEINTPANQKKATPASGGVADELLKLKSLLDAGAITQAEFDAQKAKLLAR